MHGAIRNSLAKYLDVFLQIVFIKPQINLIRGNSQTARPLGLKEILVSLFSSHNKIIFPSIIFSA